MKQPDVKPYWRVERTMLMNTQPCQVTIEVFTVLRRLEIPVCNAPIRNGTSNTMDKLLD